MMNYIAILMTSKNRYYSITHGPAYLGRCILDKHLATAPMKRDLDSNEDCQ